MYTGMVYRSLVGRSLLLTSTYQVSLHLLVGRLFVLLYVHGPASLTFWSFLRESGWTIPT